MKRASIDSRPISSAFRNGRLNVMADSRKFRFPFIELLTFSVVVLATVIVLYPGADKYVVSLVKGPVPADEIDDSSTPERPMPVIAMAEETQTLEQRVNNDFEGSLTSDFPVPGTQLPADGQLEFQDDLQANSGQLAPVYEEVEIEPLPVEDLEPIDMAPIDVETFEVVNTESDFDIEDDLQQLPMSTEEYSEAVTLTAPLSMDDNTIPEAEFTTDIEPAPGSIPTSQISVEMSSVLSSNMQSEISSTYEFEEESVQTGTRDDLPVIRQLPPQQRRTLRAVEGVLTPSIPPEDKTTARPAPVRIDNDAVHWRSAVVKNQLFHENELEPALKQTVAPKIETASLPVLPQPIIPQPFARGFIPEHIPGERAPMMSQEMQDNNDFEFRPLKKEQIAPKVGPVQGIPNPLR